MEHSIRVPRRGSRWADKVSMNVYDNYSCGIKSYRSSLGPKLCQGLSTCKSEAQVVHRSMICHIQDPRGNWREAETKTRTANQRPIGFIAQFSPCSNLLVRPVAGTSDDVQAKIEGYPIRSYAARLMRLLCDFCQPQGSASWTRQAQHSGSTDKFHARSMQPTNPTRMSIFFLVRIPICSSLCPHMSSHHGNLFSCQSNSGKATLTLWTNHRPQTLITIVFISRIVSRHSQSPIKENHLFLDQSNNGAFRVTNSQSGGNTVRQLMQVTPTFLLKTINQKTTSCH